uniref:Uncharacterized protein n=1 Tax=Lactuca sativa TaxID=4236 RepID=A0A9R1VEU5_LACSA|nr:hypothetical protein LSAT_V11C500240630 [Lactuca sativa]
MLNRKSLHEQDVKTGIPAAVYKLADNIDDWNRFAWGTYIWKYTSCMMRAMFEKIEEFREFKQANPESKKGHKYTVPGFILPFKPNNQPINIVANPEELMLSFYVRYVNWTLNPVESPPRQHSSVRNSPPQTSTKALVKRLLGIVADLSSKVDHEADTNVEPDKGFREEEEIINEVEEEKYYHDTHFDYDDISTHAYCDMECLAHGKTADERKVNDIPSRT